MKTRTEHLGGDPRPACRWPERPRRRPRACSGAELGWPAAAATTRAGAAWSAAVRRAFTLLELLVVIGIIGILAAISVPTLNAFKPDHKATATRQLLDALSYARQLAIGQRTTVYMVFVPTNFWTDPAYNPASWTARELKQATNLFDKQGIGYTFVTLRSLGDQPGHHSARYLAPWRTLPEGAFIPPVKFLNAATPPASTPVLTIDTNGVAPFDDISIYRFRRTSDVPFPAETAPPSTVPGQKYVQLPYIAFNYQGQLVDTTESVVGRNEIIPLAKGAVGYSRDGATKTPRAGPPSFQENPVGNVSNAYNVINIDLLTGRARVDRMEVR